jgi:hypothetical protein
VVNGTLPGISAEFSAGFYRIVLTGIKALVAPIATRPMFDPGCAVRSLVDQQLRLF